MQIASGTMVDRYHVMELLGEGGMAIVYKAIDTRLKREVALKVIRSEVFPPSILEQVLARFEREATSLARMQHSNILTVFDFGEYNHAPYLVSEYLAGGTLRVKMGRQIPAIEAARLLQPVASALTYAHTAGVVHRDVKPANVLFTTTGTPKLADFGIARLLGMDASTQLTGTGMGMGTPAYMAPEQWHGDVSPSVDTYALGVVLFEMLTGRLPFEAQTPVELAIMMATKPLPDPRQFAPHLQDDIIEILRYSLQSRPADRYASMGDFAQSLQDLIPAAPGRDPNRITGPTPPLQNFGGPQFPQPTLPPTEVDPLTKPPTPTGGVRQPTPYPAPPLPPTFPAGSSTPSRMTPSAPFDSGATFQTPAGVVQPERTYQTPAGGQGYSTPPPPAPVQNQPAAYSDAAYPASPPDTNKRSPVGLIVGVVLIVLCCAIGAGVSWYGYQQYTATQFQLKVATGLAQTAIIQQAVEQTVAAQTETARQATSQAAAAQTEAAAIASARAEATRSAAAAAQAATLAAVPAPLQGPLNWPVLYMSDFASDNGDWSTGSEDDEFAVLSRSIRNGAFLMEMTAKKGVASRTTPDVPNGVDTQALNEFYLALDLVMTGPASMQGGVVFRYNKDAGYYVFLINRSGEYSMWSYNFNESAWTNVVEATQSNAISLNGVNRIEMVGRNDRYYIYVNRTLLVDTTAAFQSGGWVGTVSELTNSGDKGEWRFDNFEIRSP